MKQKFVFDKVKFYIASGWDNKEQVRKLAELLVKNYGWKWTYDWTTCTVYDNYIDIAVNEAYAIEDSDVLIVLFPGGKGTHIEIGIAVALKKIVIAIDDVTPLLNNIPEQLAKLPPMYFHLQICWVDNNRKTLTDLAEQIYEIMINKMVRGCL